MCCFIFGPLDVAVCFRSSRGPAAHGSASAGLFALGWEGSSLVQPPRLGAVLGDGWVLPRWGQSPWGASLGTSPGTRGAASSWDGGCGGALGAGEGCTLQAAKQGATSPMGAPALSWHYGRF